MKHERIDKVQKIIAELLAALGENPDRAGIKGTPLRVAKMYEELLVAGAPPAMTSFPAEQDHLELDQMIVVDGIGFYSLCEHHMIPFFGQAHIGYIPTDRVVGLSKLARVVEHFSRRLQVQERMTAQIADYIYQELLPQGMCVMLSATHLCMSMRGIKKENAHTHTHAIRGTIDKNEFMRLLEMRRVGR